MPIIDCSCKGISPECEKCFGRGYYDTDDKEYKSHIHFSKETKNKETKEELPFTEKISSLSAIELKQLINKIISRIDKNSNIQNNILNSIPFSSSRMSYINLRMKEIEKIEIEKKDLKEKLKLAIEQSKLLNTRIISTPSSRKRIMDVKLKTNLVDQIKFKWFLSTIDLDSFSIEDLILLKRELQKRSSKI